MTGLQVWLHPSSRTKISSRFPVLSKTQCSTVLTENRELGTKNFLLNPAPFGRPASIMRNRRRVLDGPDFNSGRGQRADSRFATRTRATYSNVNGANAVIAGQTGSVRCGLLRGKRSALTGAAEAKRARALPRQHIAGHIGYGHDRVVERSLNVNQSVWDVLALFLLKRLFLAFFVGSRWGSACCCWFCHVFKVLSSQFPVLSSPALSLN